MAVTVTKSLGSKMLKPLVTTTGSATSTQCIKPVMLLLLICFDVFLKFLAPDRDREAELKRAALA
jgi:hypothetical protein